MAVSGQRFGRAVLELLTDKTQYSAGLKAASAEATSFAQKSQITYKSMVGGMSAAGREASASTKMLAGMSQAGQQVVAQQRAMAAQIQSTARAWATARQANAKVVTDQLAAQRSMFSAESANKARAWGQMLQQSAQQSAAAQQKAAQASMTWGQRLQQFSSQAVNAARTSSAFTQTFAGFTAANLASSVVSRLGSELGEMADVGLRLPGMQRSFEQLSKGVGESSTTMIGTLRRATSGLVSDFDLMQSSNKALLLGLPVNSKEMGKLAQTATVLGRAMGQDATKSLDDLITALGRSSPMILDNLGLSVKLGEAHEAYAMKLGKSADELDEQEKKMAFYEAALQAADDKVRSLGTVQLTLTDRLRQSRVSLGNWVAEAVAAVNKSQSLIGVFDDTTEAVSLLDDALILLRGSYANLPSGSLPTWMSQLMEWQGSANRIGSRGVFGLPLELLRQAAETKRNVTALTAPRPDLPVTPLGALGRGYLPASPEQATAAMNATKDYVKQLSEARAKIAALSPATRAQIKAFADLNQEVKGAGKQFGLTDEQLQMYIESLKKGSTAMTDAQRAAKRLKDLSVDVGKGLRTLGNADFLTEFESKIEDAYREYAKLGVTGAKVPKEIQDGLRRVMAIRFEEWTRRQNEELQAIGHTMAWLNDQTIALTDSIDERIGDSIKAREEAAVSAMARLHELEFQRAQYAIDRAQLVGATWQQVAAMETALAKRRTDVAVAEAERLFRESVKNIHLTTSEGRNEYDALAADHNANVQAMREAFVQAELLKREELRRTHSFWLNLWEQTRANLRELQRVATGNLTGLLFNAGHDPGGSLKKAAQDAREAYEELTGAGAKQQAEIATAQQKLADAITNLDAARARKAPAEELQRLSRIVAESRIAYQQISKEGKGSAEEIEAAFKRMTEAQEAANNSFGTRFKNYWQDLKQATFRVFDDILSAFTRRFLDGMMNALQGRQGGFTSAFSDLFGGGGGQPGGGGGLLGGVMQNIFGGGPGGGRGGLIGRILGLGSGAASTAAAGGVLASSSVPVAASMFAPGAVGAGSAAAGGAGAGAAGGGFGSTMAGLATNPITIGVAGGAALTWAIWKKGLFRGGWEGIEGNRRRDQHLAQWGPPGTGPESGFGKLAAFLTEKTGEHGGGRIFQDFLSGDKKRFEAAQAAIVELAGKAGKRIQAFHTGGLVPGYGEKLAKVLGGEGIVSQLGMSRIGVRGLEQINAPGDDVIAGVGGVAGAGAISGTARFLGGVRDGAIAEAKGRGFGGFLGFSGAARAAASASTFAAARTAVAAAAAGGAGVSAQGLQALKMTGEPGDGTTFGDVAGAGAISGMARFLGGVRDGAIAEAKGRGFGGAIAALFKPFHTGGLVPGYGEKLAKVLGGEGVVSQLGMSRLGVRGLDALNMTAPALATPQLASGTSAERGRPVVVNVTVPVNIEGTLDRESVREVFRRHIVPEIKASLLLNQDGLADAISGATGW